MKNVSVELTELMFPGVTQQMKNECRVIEEKIYRRLCVGKTYGEHFFIQYALRLIYILCNEYFSTSFHGCVFFSE